MSVLNGSRGLEAAVFAAAGDESPMLAAAPARQEVPSFADIRLPEFTTCSAAQQFQPSPHAFPAGHLGWGQCQQWPPFPMAELTPPLTPRQVSAPASPGSDALRHTAKQDGETRLELLTEKLHRLCEQVHAQEDRQLVTDRRMVRVDSLLQALTEEHEVQSSRLRQLGYSQGALADSSPTSACGETAARLQALEKGQRAVAAGVQRAMQLALKSEEAQRTLHDRLDEAAGRAVHEASESNERIERIGRLMGELQEGRELTDRRVGNLMEKEDAREQLEQRMSRFLEREEMVGEQQLDPRIAKHEEALEQLERCVKGLAHKEALERLERRVEGLAQKEQPTGHQSLEGRLAKHEASQKRLEQRMKEVSADGIDSRIAHLESSLADQGKQLKEMDNALGELQSAAAAEALFGGGCLEERAEDFGSLGADRVEANDQDKADGRLEELSSLLTSQAEAISSLQQQVDGLAIAKLRQQVEELQDGIKRSVTPRPQEPEAEAAPAAMAVGAVAKKLGRAGEDWAAALQVLESQVNSGIADVRRRMDDMEELLDENVLSQIRQVIQQLPDTSGKLERLGKQCAECLCKTESHEVRLDLTRTSLDTQDQRLQALSERLERTLVRGNMGCLTGFEKSETLPRLDPWKPLLDAPALEADKIMKRGQRTLPTNVLPAGQSDLSKTSQKLDDICAKLKISSLEEAPPMSRESGLGAVMSKSASQTSLARQAQAKAADAAPPALEDQEVAAADAPPETAETSSARRSYSCAGREALEAAGMGSDEPWFPLSQASSPERGNISDFTGC